MHAIWRRLLRLTKCTNGLSCNRSSPICRDRALRCGCIARSLVLTVFFFSVLLEKSLMHLKSQQSRYQGSFYVTSLVFILDLHLLDNDLHFLDGH